MTGKETDGDRYPSPAVARALTVLETLVGSDEDLTLTALARETGIPLATCASIVYTLEQRDYATRKIVGRSHFWRPTLRLYGLATQLIRKVDLSSVANQEMRDLAERVGMPVHLGVLTGASIVYVAKASLPGFIQFDTYPGKVAPFNLTALGRAIAAYLPDDELRPLLSQLAPGQGPKGVPADQQEFEAELTRVRQQGYSTEDEEEQAGIACIAAPVFDASGHVTAAVGLTGFAKDFNKTATRHAESGIRDLAKLISQRLGASAPLPTDLV
jgi:DNA-binding IclR family transcriptional regulator